jgi:hypothetical protein
MRAQVKCLQFNSAGMVALTWLDPLDRLLGPRGFPAGRGGLISPGGRSVAQN